MHSFQKVQLKFHRKKPLSLIFTQWWAKFPITVKLLSLTIYMHVTFNHIICIYTSVWWKKWYILFNPYGNVKQRLQETDLFRFFQLWKQMHYRNRSQIKTGNWEIFKLQDKTICYQNMQTPVSTNCVHFTKSLRLYHFLADITHIFSPDLR